MAIQIIRQDGDQITVETIMAPLAPIRYVTQQELDDAYLEAACGRRTSDDQTRDWTALGWIRDQVTWDRPDNEDEDWGFVWASKKGWFCEGPWTPGDTIWGPYQTDNDALEAASRAMGLVPGVPVVVDRDG